MSALATAGAARNLSRKHDKSPTNTGDWSTTAAALAGNISDSTLAGCTTRSTMLAADVGVVFCPMPMASVLPFRMVFAAADGGSATALTAAEFNANID